MTPAGRGRSADLEGDDAAIYDVEVEASRLVARGFEGWEAHSVP